MKPDIGNGIIAGLISFLATTVPWLFFLAVGYAVLGPAAWTNKSTLFLVALLIGFAFLSAFVGFSWARKFKQLRIVAIAFIVGAEIALVSLIVYWWR